MVKLSDSPDNPEDRERLVLDTVERYRATHSCHVVRKLQLFASIEKMADRGDGFACYIVGACYVGEGPCGDGLLGINREKAQHYLRRAQKLGNPHAHTVIKKHGLAAQVPQI